MNRPCAKVFASGRKHLGRRTRAAAQKGRFAFPYNLPTTDVPSSNSLPLPKSGCSPDFCNPRCGTPERIALWGADSEFEPRLPLQKRRTSLGCPSFLVSWRTFHLLGASESPLRQGFRLRAKTLGTAHSRRGPVRPSPFPLQGRSDRGNL